MAENSVGSIKSLGFVFVKGISPLLLNDDLLCLSIVKKLESLVQFLQNHQ